MKTNTNTNDTFRASFTLPNGKRKFVRANSKEELEKKLLELKVQANAGIDICDSTTFGEFAEIWFKAYKDTGGISDAHRASILNALNVHILPYISGYPIRSITQMHVQGCFRHMAGKSTSLFNKVRTTLGEIFDAAVANRIIPVSPMQGIRIAAKPRKKEESEAITESEETEILRTMREQAMSQGSTKEMQRAYYMCVFGFKFGMRRGEIMGLKESDFDFTSHDVKLDRTIIWPNNAKGQVSTNMKTENAHRTLPIPDSVYDDVLQLVSGTGNDCFLFALDDGSPLSYSAVRNAWDTVKEVTGTKFGKHIMRHSYCTRLYEKGFLPKEVQYLMGHSSPDMSLKVYAHFTKRSQYGSTSEKLRSSF